MHSPSNNNKYVCAKYKLFSHNTLNNVHRYTESSRNAIVFFSKDFDFKVRVRTPRIAVGSVTTPQLKQFGFYVPLGTLVV